MRNAALRFLDPVFSFPRTGARTAVRRLRLLPKGLQPLSLAGSSSGLALTIVCSGVILVVVIVEAVRPGLASLGSLLFLPVLAVAWLAETRQAIAVSAVAVTARVFGHSMSGVDLGTALSEAVMIVAIAITARLAARSLVEGQAAEARVREQQYILDSLTQREEIAARVNDAAVRRLFGLSINLQAMSALLDDVEQRQRLGVAIRDIDALCTDLRNLLFEAGHNADESPLAMAPRTEEAVGTGA